jgi:hypothetical protein
VSDTLRGAGAFEAAPRLADRDVAAGDRCPLRIAKAKGDGARILPAVVELLDLLDGHTGERVEEVSKRQVDEGAEPLAPAVGCRAGRISGAPTSGATVPRMKAEQIRLDKLLRRADETGVVSDIDERSIRLQHSSGFSDRAGEIVEVGVGERRETGGKRVIGERQVGAVALDELDGR